MQLKILFWTWVLLISVSTTNSRFYSPDRVVDDQEDDEDRAPPIFVASMADDLVCTHRSNWSSKLFEPIRIKYFWREDAKKKLDANAMTFLNVAMNHTVNHYQNLLRVRRATSPIGIERGCKGALVDFPTHLRKKDAGCNETAGGVPDVDFIVYVSAEDSKSCGGGTLAYASVCENHPYDRRPVAGLVNVCPKQVTPEQWNMAATIATLQHELMHAFIFSSGLFRLFYDGSPNPVSDTTTTVKRMWKINPNVEITHDALLVTTPAVKDYVRLHFNCPTLEGAELENEGGSGTKDQHWEKRLFWPEVMTGVISRRSYLSNLTLLLMEDSGWYKTNMSMADSLNYGKDAGCEFAMKSCREFMDKKPQGMRGALPFCNWADYVEKRKQNSTVRACSKDRTFVSHCDWEDQEPIDSKFQYFGDKMLGQFSGAKVSGKIGLNDGCPVWSELYYGGHKQNSFRHGDSVCANADSQPFAGANWGAELYGNDSKCFAQDGKFETFTCYKVVGAASQVSERAHGAGCYKYRCRKGRLFVQANHSSTSGVRNQYKHMEAWKVCWSNASTISIRRQQRSGENFEMRYHKGVLKCPPCSELCETNEQYKGFKCEPEVRIDTTDLSKKPCNEGARVRPTIKPSILFLCSVILIYIKCLCIG